MCWKKLIDWLNGPEEDPEPIPDPTGETKHTALLFGINNYPGSANDLNGCLNDIADASVKITSVNNDLNTVESKLREISGFTIKKFKDSEATIEKFKSECENAIAKLKPGSVVVVFFDSCFSEGATRGLEMGIVDKKHPTKSRFKDPGLPPRTNVGKKIFRNDLANMKWLAFSGCGEHETSADAYINGRYNGAFTYYALKAMKAGDQWQMLYNIIRSYLPGSGFRQTPALEGPNYLRIKKMFVDPTLVIWYSGHGSYDYDQNGDEIDGYDEVICLHNGNLVDDDINTILQKIPV